MYRRSALGSARFHDPQATTTTTSSQRDVSIPDTHPVFETVGLDNRALTQVCFLAPWHTGVGGQTLTGPPRDLSLAAECDVPAALPAQFVRILAGQVQAPGRCRAAHI